METVADSFQTIIDQMKADDDKRQAKIQARFSRINRLFKEYEVIDSAE